MAITDNLSFALELEEASGTRNDSTANALHFTDVNTVTQGTGKTGNCGQFTAANTESLSRANGALVQPGPNMTIEIWVNVDSTTGGCIFIKDDVGSHRVFSLNHGDGGAGVVKWLVFDSSSGLAAIECGTTIATGAWSQIFAWYDSSDKKARISINRGTVAVSAALTNGIKTTGTSSVEIGGRAASASPYAGRIDMVRFWQRVLTSGEMDTQYNAGAGLSYAAMTAGGGPVIPVFMKQYRQRWT